LGGGFTKGPRDRKEMVQDKVKLGKELSSRKKRNHCDLTSRYQRRGGD